jgi:hypothetical protein
MNLTAACGGTGLDLGALMGPGGWPEGRDWKWQAPSTMRHEPSEKDAGTLVMGL